MSDWSGFFEDLPASLPDRKVTKLPEAAKLARSLRSGKTVSDLAVHYGVAGRVIRVRLRSAGWDDDTGLWNGDRVTSGNPPLAVRGSGPGASVHHIGGGDNPNVVPLVARPIRERPKHEGFAWPAPSGAPFPTVPRPRPRVRPSRRRFNSDGTSLTRPRKLDDATRLEIARRYEEQLDSSVSLAAEYGVNQRTIRNILREEGVHVRNRSEAGYLRWAANHPEEAAARGQRPESDGAA